MFKIVSHTADIGLELEAVSLEALFEDAAKGWKFYVLEKSMTEGKIVRHIHLKSTTEEDLLVQWVSELNYFLTVQHWVFHEVKSLQIFHDSDICRLDARIVGESFDPVRHSIQFEIKAITYHQLDIQQRDQKYKTRLFFDI